MSSQPQSTPPLDRAGLELQAAAHDVHAVVHRLIALTKTLPHPSKEIVAMVYENGSREAFDHFPTIALQGWIEAIAMDKLAQAAIDLEKAAAEHLPELPW